MLTIPPLADSDMFWFRFNGSNVRRQGALLAIDPEQGLTPRQRLKDFSDKLHYQCMATEAHYLSWCVTCQRQADFVLLYKKMGIIVREKYCESCAKENIIKL